MGVMSYIFIGVLALIGGGVSYGVWLLKRKVAAWAEKRRAAKAAPVEEEVSSSDDSFPIFDDALAETPVSMSAPPPPPVDVAGEFARLHKAVGEIAKAQVRMIETSGAQEDGADTEATAELVREAVKQEAEAIAEQLGQRIDALAERIETIAAGGGDDEASAEASQDLLKQLIDRPSGPELQAISDLILPQIALLGEDVERLGAKLAEVTLAIGSSGAPHEASNTVEEAAVESALEPDLAEPVADLAEPDPMPDAGPVGADEVGPDAAEAAPSEEMQEPPIVEPDLAEAHALQAKEDVPEQSVAEESEQSGTEAEAAEAPKDETAEDAASPDEDDSAADEAPGKKLFGKGINYVPAQPPSAEKPSGAAASDRMMV